MPDPRDIIAEITDVQTCLVTLRWIASRPPKVFERLRDESGRTITIAHRGDEFSALAAVDREQDAPTIGSKLFVAEDQRPSPLGIEQLESIATVLAAPTADVIETGVKVLDVIAPLLDGGVTWLIGGPNVGRMKFLEELHMRLTPIGARQTVVFPIVPELAASIPQALAEQPQFPDDQNGPVRTVWLISEAANDPALAQRDALGSTRLVFNPELAGRGYLPAVDPVTTVARAISDPDLLERIIKVMRSPESIVAARRFERYFAQPFFSAEAYLSLPGTRVARATALASCREILAGHDPTAGYDFPTRSVG